MSIRHILSTLWLSIQFTPYFIGGNIIQIVLGLTLLLYLMASKKFSKMPEVLLFEIEYSLEFVPTNPPFLYRPSDTKIQIAIISW